jgi:hypothetical protein
LCAAVLSVVAAQTAAAQTPWLNQDVIWPAGAQEPSPAQAPLAPENVPPAALAAVHGVVRNGATGQPLPRALVRIEGNADTGALTDGEGRFEIPGVPVGAQTIQLRKPGFHDRPYASEDVDYQGDGPAHNVLVAAEMPDLNFALTPASVIHGRVELSTGDPAQGITVTLLKQVICNGRAVWAQNGVTQTNSNGAYRFANLPGGVYALYTQPTFESEPAVTGVAAEGKVVRNGYASIFYPAAREFSDAARIRLKAGQQAEANLLLTLEPFYTVTVTAILPNGKPFSGNSTSDGAELSAFGALDGANRQTAYTQQFDRVTHTFQATLPDGIYTFLVQALLGKTNSIGQFDPGGNNGQHTLLSGLTEFSIEGHPVANLTVPLGVTPRWPVHLRAIRTKAHDNSNLDQELQNLLTVTATDAGEAPADGTSSETRAGFAGPDLLEMNGVAPGPYWISTQVFDNSLCVDSFTAGPINLAREPLNVALGSSPPPMELTLRDDCAKLTLELPPALTAFLPGDELFYTVYVVPDFDSTTDIPPMNMHPSSGATLTVDGPTPGQQVTLSAGTTGNLMLEVPGR